MGESSESVPGLTRALDARLSAAGGDPYAALADLLGGAEVGDGSEALSLRGRTLDGVRLGRILGTGGMGTTYAGVDADGASVAVKLLGRLSDTEQARFERECAIVQGLQHPNVVRYQRHGLTPGGTPYLVMDLVDGDDLDTLLGTIERGEAPGTVGEALIDGLDPALPVRAQAEYRRRILSLLASVADALEHAHRAGIVHRDVKPANVVVRADLSPVLIDFGLAHDLFQNVSWTRSGAVVGTVGWMAPEQLDGDRGAVGPRTDVFALGLLLHRALTGRELRRDLRDLLRFRRGRLVLENEDVAGLDPGVVAVLYGCLEPKPEHRYASAKDVAADLRALRDGGRPSRRAPRWLGKLLRRRGTQLALGALACGVVGSVVAGAWPELPSVTITCLEDDQNGVVRRADGSAFLSGPRLPMMDMCVPYGVYELVYYSKRIPPLPFRLVVDRPIVRLDMLNVPRGELERLDPEDVHYEGRDLALLDLTTYAEGTRLLIDGKETAWSDVPIRSFPAQTGLAASRFRAAIAPGVYSLQVKGPDGAEEQQDVVVPPCRIVPVILLGRHLEQVAGRFRATWASVLGPAPRGVDLTLTGAAGTFLDALGLAVLAEDDQSLPQVGLVHNRRNTCVTALMAEESVAVLSVAFPSAVRSLVACFNAERGAEEDELSVDWRLDDGPWTTIDVPSVTAGPAPYEIDGVGSFDRGFRHAIAVSNLPAPGVRKLAIRFRMLSRQRPIDSPTLRVLSAYVNELGFGHAHPALEIVADPDPSPRRRR